MGTLILPSGQHVNTSHEDRALPIANVVLAREVWKEWEMSYVDPPPPPEPGEGGLRAKDLRNRVIVLKPFKHGSAMGKPRDGKEAEPYDYIECECWVIDGGDAPEVYEPNLRIAWWRVKEQLSALMGEYVVGRVKEQDDRSVILEPLPAAKKGGVDKVWDQIVGQKQAAPATDADQYGFSDEPF